MADQSQLADQIIDMLVEHLGVDEDEVTLQTDIVEDLGADSIDAMDLMMALGEEFKVGLPDDFESIKTVQDVVDYVAANSKKDITI